MIKRFENFQTDYEYLANFSGNIRDMANERNTPYDLEYIKGGCDKFIGSGFYEKVVKRSEEIVESLEYIKPKLDLLNGFADVKFNHITSTDKDLESKVVMGVATKMKGYQKHNGFWYIRNINQDKIMCQMIAEFLYNTSLGSHSKRLRNTIDSMAVREDKYKVLNMPDNADLYPDLNRETIDYIKNFDLNKEFVTSIRLVIDTDYQSYRNVNMDIKECDEAFEKFLKILNTLVKKNSVVVKDSSYKYHKTTTEYKVDLHFN